MLGDALLSAAELNLLTTAYLNQRKSRHASSLRTVSTLQRRAHDHDLMPVHASLVLVQRTACS